MKVVAVRIGELGQDREVRVALRGVNEGEVLNRDLAKGIAQYVLRGVRGTEELLVDDDFRCYRIGPDFEPEFIGAVFGCEEK